VVNKSYLSITVIKIAMKKHSSFNLFSIFYFLFSIFSLQSFSQTRIPITNNMVINSNSDIKFIPGDYSFTDPTLDGVIKLTNVHDVILDGDSCTVNGTNYGGYMIKIDGSHHITIKNFDSVYKYKYAVYITNSHHININGNMFSRNRVDSSGWIDVWANYTSALGGGVMMYQCRAANIYNNTMKYQNDGVALYHCDSINVINNDFAWNTSYGIRMFWTDSCQVSYNLANHINRPNTDPSDCAAILLIISNSNWVENNDFTYSGDGIFLGQYGHSNIPNNNFFGWNDCSFSPHNAIEATFADGNVYKNNKCNYSPYGMWLGYSFNSVIENNEVIGNYNSGIAIDRGFNNKIKENTIFNNPYGIELWKGANISGYETQNSQDYIIESNLLEGNEIAITASNTNHMVVKNNLLRNNQQSAVYFNGTALSDTITGNTFQNTTSFHMRNFSANDIHAENNLYVPDDSTMILEKIFDKHINPSKGTVFWNPRTAGSPPVYQYDPPCDMAEQPSIWYAYGDPGYGGKRIPEELVFDDQEKVVGDKSVKVVTGRGYDIGINYRPTNDSLSWWNLTDNDTLSFWVRTIKHPMGFQNFSVRIGDSKTCYFRYTASPSLLNNANNAWVQYKFPLTGNSQFQRTSSGQMSLDRTNYVEIHADTWDYGYTIWLDGVQFSPCNPVTALQPPFPDSQIPELTLFPNPVGPATSLTYTLPDPALVTLTLFDCMGKDIAVWSLGNQPSGKHEWQWPNLHLSSGIYFLVLNTEKHRTTAKLLIE
jgi:parallel beta-helix repeat protein